MTKLSDGRHSTAWLGLFWAGFFLLVTLACASKIQDYWANHAPPDSDLSPSSPREPFSARTSSPDPILSALEAVDRKLGILLQQENKGEKSSPQSYQVTDRLEDQWQKIGPLFDQWDAQIVEWSGSRTDRLKRRLLALENRLDAALGIQEQGILPRPKPFQDQTHTSSVIPEPPLSPPLNRLNKRVDRPWGGGGSVTEQEHAPQDRMIRDLQNRLAQEGMETVYDWDEKQLQFSSQMDFDRGSYQLNDAQAQGIKTLAKTLARVLSCFVQHAETGRHDGNTGKGQCPEGRGDVPLQAIYIVGYSTEDNVATARFNYNWRLATIRSLNILKDLLLTRPELLNFSNRKGKSLFKSIAKLVKVGDSRAKRVDVLFVF